MVGKRGNLEIPKGSKIVDVWDSRRQIPYDYKFGGARVTPRDRVEYAEALLKKAKSLVQIKP
jgi:hypothetical protein